MVKKYIEHLDMEQIAESGQVFRIQKNDSGIWMVPAAGHYVEVKQQESLFTFSCEEEEFESFWKYYWNLDLDYGALKARVNAGDAYMTAACIYGWGIRVLQQDLWEVIVTFLISQNNNMTRIRKSVQALCQALGEEKTGIGLKGDGVGQIQTSYFTFPEPWKVAEAGLAGLAKLGLGYRDKYIYEMAVWCNSLEGQAWLMRLRDSGYEEAHSCLMERLGIGRKVADCICLFGLHHVEAFPMDTHVKQILASHYPEGFPMEQYETCAGIMQQYMFYYKVKEKV